MRDGFTATPIEDVVESWKILTMGGVRRPAETSTACEGASKAAQD